MKCKLLPILAIIVFTTAASYSQIPEVMVGDTGIIITFAEPKYHDEDLPRAGFKLHRHTNQYFFYTFNPSGFPTGDDVKQIIATAFFIPHFSGIQTDTANFDELWNLTPPPDPRNLGYDSVLYQFTAKGIDSVVVIKIKDTTIILPIDTQARKYKSKMDPFFFYSNIADSVLFDGWQLVIDPAAQISFTVDSNRNAISEYRSKPFTRKKQLNFTFISSLPATDTAHSFPATMKTRVRYKGVDSVYSNNFTIILPAAPKSGVSDIASNDFSFTINPNPISKLTTFIVSTANSEQITLEIYDILGNRKVVIASNEIINGSRTFGFDASGFASGSYFARLVCGNQVITRKLFIEK